MKVLVVSDSHGLTKELEEIQTRHIHEVDAMFHCGDSELASAAAELDNFTVVRGNCDFDQGFPTEQLKQVKGIRYYITHGHLYNVKMSLMPLSYRALEIGADVVCFGHSHISGAEVIDGVLFLNPGSIRLPRIRKEKTYALLEIVANDEGKEAIVKFYTVDGFELPSMMVKCKIG
ncbi:metallophosphoesterase family protein [Calidifontibacillus oryziterrae]|uniref:metallophosphoesterase family protein n=1 Tax=Calidifontibacillus oryziterrae TaxID=1191699 RepID=UPI0003049D19|nr:metallophosphoesterase [Calidifontibacillus oryziterrae]